ncbi:MAG: glycosyltransferase family 2 protein [Actinomycetota bacterium]
MPVYNERARLRASLERLLKAELPLPVEILVVDDGSQDDGVSTIGDFVEAGRVRLIRHERNQGKGAAVRTGIAQASGDVLTIYDADLEYEPSDLRRLLELIVEGEAEVVYGTRSFGAHSAYSFWYVLGNRAVSFWTSFLFNTWLSDIETCFKVAKTSVWRSLRLRSRGFGLEAEVTARFLKAGHRIFEAPISYRARTREEGKKLRWTDGIAALRITLGVRLFG